MVGTATKNQQGKTATVTAAGKKQIPLRLSDKLYQELVAWAEADFRSVNGQIEYLLTECVKKRKGHNSDTG
jgi:hypothetical protein